MVSTRFFFSLIEFLCLCWVDLGVKLRFFSGVVVILETLIFGGLGEF